MAQDDPITPGKLGRMIKPPYTCTSLVKLSGGFANFTYRGKLLEPLANGAVTVIFKHGEPYTASNKEFKLDLIRCHYEQTMLTALRSLPPVVLENVHVTTPYLYYYSPPSTQILEDYPGSTELKDYLCTHKPDGEGISRMGTALGAWLRGFHDWGAALEQQDLRDTLRENSWGKKLKAAITFGRLVETIDMFPSVLRDSKELFADVEKRAMREAEDPGGDLIHGDFWSGNILLRKGDIPGPRDSPLKLMIVDWELAHLGSRAVDLGQCLAELYLLWHFLDVEAGFQMIIRFLRGYGPVERDMALRICLSFGTHLVVWPCRVPHWERGQKMEDCVRYGAECVKYAWKGDVGWLGSEPLLQFLLPA